MAPDGSVFVPPRTDIERLFSKAYDYCRQNWCAQDSSHSLFTYGFGESFDNIYKCNVPFSIEVEEALQDIFQNPSRNQALSDACGDSLECLVDGFCGDINDANAAIGNKQAIIETQEEIKQSIFSREEVVVEEVLAVFPQPSSSPTPASSNSPSNPTIFAPTDASSSASSTLLDGYFGKSGHNLEFATEYYITITIKGTTCKVGDDERDFTHAQIKAIETALATGFCDADLFPAGSCSVAMKTSTCKDAHHAPKQFRGRKLADDTDDNDLVIKFVVSVVGQCMHHDCSDGDEMMQAGTSSHCISVYMSLVIH